MPSRLTRPKLTTIPMPTLAAGRMAVDLLLQLINDPDDTTAAQTTLQTALVVRDSTASPGRRP
jgi:LacI family transcriptional regulator